MSMRTRKYSVMVEYSLDIEYNQVIWDEWYEVFREVQNDYRTTTKFEGVLEDRFIEDTLDGAYTDEESLAMMLMAQLKAQPMIDGWLYYDFHEDGELVQRSTVDTNSLPTEPWIVRAKWIDEQYTNVIEIKEPIEIRY